MDDAAIGHIAELSSLKRLGLYSNPGISDAGALQLARLKQLEFLQLQFTKVTDETLDAIAGLEKLHFLDLRGTQVTTPARDAFAQAHPECRILR